MRESDWDRIFEALGITLEDGVLFILFLGGWLFLAKDLKIGLIYYFTMYGIAFICYELLGLNTAKVIVAIFVSMLLMAISLYSSHQKVVA